MDVDFQLFFLAVPIGLLFTRYRRSCYAATIALILGTVIIRTALVAYYNVKTCNGNSEAPQFSSIYIKVCVAVGVWSEERKK